ncbi:hypothetical protein KVR01_007455 [Diaporthe batatas]|uniref:uncharacterized protein n=1 Tax=Diaporthe batatas TaxID=748121 RepID=UPI001D042428|nr:uncharacterized protein KVR01_007455 [Diaporthe batatas]KAG8162977.1 hypothetical protein KVR01_007455 [Diaporthe batatas]
MAEASNRMEESLPEAPRPDSMTPHDPNMQEGLRMATEAMQAAADAMTAASVSFRRQTLMQEELASRRTTWLPRRQAEDDQDGYEATRPASPSRHRVISVHQLAAALAREGFAMPEQDFSARFLAEMTPPASQDERVPATLQMPPRMPTHPARPSTATHRTSHQNLRGSSRRTTLSEGSTLINKSSGVGAARVSSEIPKPDPAWPAQSIHDGQSSHGPEYAERRRSRSRVSHGAEQSRRVSAVRWPLEAPEPEMGPGGTRDVHDSQDDYFSPVIRMGRYTYIRTDTGELRPSLDDQHWQDQQYSGQSSRTITRPPSPPSRTPRYRPYGLSAAGEMLFLAVIILAQALTLAGLSQALVPQRIIGASFPDTNPGSLAWYSAAYGLTSGTFVLPSGRLGDLFGHKKIFIIGFIWLGLWELAGGFSERVQRYGSGSGTALFIFCRAMQGVGAALLVPNAQAMIGRGYPPGPSKNIIMSLFGAAAPLGFVAGGAMAAMFAQLVSWPWGFWTMAAVCFGLAGASVLILPPAAATTRNTDVSLWKQVDGAGICLGVSGLVLFNFPFNQAPIVSWGTPYTYFILVIGVLLLGGFVYIELHAPHPLVPIASMTPATNFVLGCTGAGWACFSIWVYYALSFMEQLRGYSPLRASAAMAPGPVAGLIASLLAGFLLSKKVKPYIVLMMSMGAFTAGSLLWSLAPVGQTYWLNSFIGVLIIPFGMDMSNPAASILLSNSMAKEHQGTAASLVVTTVNYSISLALGIAGSVELAARGERGDVLAGFRGAQHLGLGLGGLGILLAAVFALRSRIQAKQAANTLAKAG